MNWMQRMGARLLGLDVKRAGDSAPPVHASSTQDGRAIGADWSAEKAIVEGLKASPWVYSATSKVATGLGSIPLVLEKRVGDGWEADPGHELQRLLDQPNPFMGRQDMGERWAYHMQLSGNALWWLNIVGGKPVELWPVQPDQIKPIASRPDFISGYEWKISASEKRVLPVDQVMHWMFVDPANPRWGLAPLQAAAAAVDMDLAAARWNRAVLANDGKPPLAVFLDSSLSIDQMRQASALIREQVDGGSIRQALVLGGASKVQPLSLNATDLDFLNGRRFSREEIAAVFGVPPILLSFGEAATYANLDAAKTVLWEDRIVPMSDDYAQGLMTRLFPYWNLTQDTHRIRADLSGVRALQANLRTEAEVGKLRSEAFKLLVDAGVPANMAATAAQVPLTDIPGGDQPRAAPAPAASPQVKSRRPPGYQRKDKSDPEDVAARLARMDEWTAEIKKRVAEILLEQGSAVASAYAAGQPWEDALSLDDWQALLEAIHTAVIEAEGAVAYTALLKSITGSGAGGAFDVLADGVVEWIDSHVGDMVKGITDTSKAALRAEIAAGVEAGEGTRAIADRIRGLHTEWAGWRADLVSRTETTAAFGAAHQLSAEQVARDSGAALVKTWVATRDSRTRDAHAAMDGETVPIDQPFSNGLMQPGEPNCRCVVTYHEQGR